MKTNKKNELIIQIIEKIQNNRLGFLNFQEKSKDLNLNNYLNDWLYHYLLSPDIYPVYLDTFFEGLSEQTLLEIQKILEK